MVLANTLNYNKIYEEADRITRELIKKEKHDKEYFALINELMDPKFKNKKLDVQVLIPTLLARYYYDIVSCNPLELHYYK